VNQFPPCSSLSGGAISPVAIPANDCERAPYALDEGYPNTVRKCGLGFSIGVWGEVGCWFLAGAEADRAGVLKSEEEAEFLKRGTLVFVFEEDGAQAGASWREVVGGASSSFISIRVEDR